MTDKVFTDYDTVIDAAWLNDANTTVNVTVPGLAASKAELAGSSTQPFSASDLKIGDQGLEGSGINIDGVTYESSFKVSDIDGTHFAQSIFHRHSTLLEPLLVGARSNSDTSTHAAVVAGQGLFTTYAAGTAGTNYKLFGSSSFVVDTGTVSETSAPGKWVLSLTPDGSTTLTPRLTITNTGKTTISSTESLVIPTGTTAQRDATPTTGGIRANVTLNQIEGYLNSAWQGLVGLVANKISFINVAGTFTSFLTNTNTAARTYTVRDRNGILVDDTDLAGIATTTTKLPQISVTANTGALTIAGIAKYLDFRSATLTSGTPSTVNADPADLVIPSGATLGSVTTVSARIVVVEMNNSGTSEYAVANILGGLQMDETNLISTTAIDTASDSANVWYSTTARSSLPYRVVAMFDAVNTTGVWSSPTLVQPAGGLALPTITHSSLIGSLSATGTSVNVTGIQSSVRKITCNYYNISTNGTAFPRVQLGVSGTPETSGYIGTGWAITGVSNSGTSGTAGFDIYSNAASYVLNGSLVLTRGASNVWHLSGSLSNTAGTVFFAPISGSKPLAGNLDMVRFTTSNGTDAYTAGSFSLLMEY